MKYYLYINTTTYEVVRCTPVKDTVTAGCIEVDQDVGFPISQGDFSVLKDYFVTHDGEQYHLNKKQFIAPFITDRLKQASLQEIKLRDNADCSIIINNSTRTVTTRLNRLLGIELNNYFHHGIEGLVDHFTIYITKKNDPTYLLFYYEVNLKDLLMYPDGVVTQLPNQYSSVSVYTKPVASSYSVEFLNDPNSN